MAENSRRAMVLRLGALFFGPMLAFGLLFLGNGNGDGIVPALVLYPVLLIGLGLFAAPTMVQGVGPRIGIGLALAFGMLLVHLVVGFAGCTAALFVLQ